MVTDHERILQDLKVHLQTKDSHGRRELSEKLVELEAKHTLTEGFPERALRLHGAVLSHELGGTDEAPADDHAAGVNGNGAGQSTLVGAR